MTLIDTLRSAGELSQTVARYLQSTGDRDLFPLADALIEDATGHSSVSDRNTLDDRDRSRADYAAARARRDDRTALHRTLTDLPRDYRVRMIDELAAGRGAREAEALQTAADAQLAAIRDGLRADAFATATEA